MLRVTWEKESTMLKMTIKDCLNDLCERIVGHLEGTVSYYRLHLAEMSETRVQSQSMRIKIEA